MRRADRLFRIVQMMRGGRLVTARRLAERMEVSERTIYRDVADLQASGVPIDGEAGVGYVMRAGYHLPPLMFTRDEVSAIVAGARLIRAWGGTEMARSADEALVKVAAVLPEAMRDGIERVPVHAFATEMTDALRARLDEMEAAADGRVALRIDYADSEGAPSTRTIRPLGLWFWGKVWTLIAWCELRNDFRMFRVDRITGSKPEGRRFRDEAGKTLRDFYARAHHQPDR